VYKLGNRKSRVVPENIPVYMMGSFLGFYVDDNSESAVCCTTTEDDEEQHQPGAEIRREYCRHRRLSAELLQLEVENPHYRSLHSTSCLYRALQKLSPTQPVWSAAQGIMISSCPDVHSIYVNRAVVSKLVTVCLSFFPSAKEVMFSLALVCFVC